VWGPWRLLSNRPRHGSSARASGTATPRAGRTRSRRTSGWSRPVRVNPPPGPTSASWSTGSVATARGRPRTARRSRTTRAAVRPPTTSEASTRTAASPRRRSPTTAGRLRSRPTTPTPTLTSPARWCGSSAARRRSDTGSATSTSTRAAPGRGSRAPTSSSSSRPTRASPNERARVRVLLVGGGLAVFGPIAPAAAIEGSKAFAKDLMARNAIPTARFATFADPARARGYCREVGPPLVVKADGLAGGKGAIVCRTLADADEAVAECMERAAFGAAGATVVVEEFLSGEEVSFFALANRAAALPHAPAQDHKTVFDGDQGPNPGG